MPYPAAAAHAFVFAFAASCQMAGTLRTNSIGRASMKSRMFSFGGVTTVLEWHTFCPNGFHVLNSVLAERLEILCHAVDEFLLRQLSGGRNDVSELFCRSQLTGIEKPRKRQLLLTMVVGDMYSFGKLILSGSSSTSKPIKNSSPSNLNTLDGS